MRIYRHNKNLKILDNKKKRKCTYVHVSTINPYTKRFFISFIVINIQNNLLLYNLKQRSIAFLKHCLNIINSYSA